MYRNTYVFCFLVVSLAGLGGCSGDKTAQESKKAASAPDTIKGKAQVLLNETSAADEALNAGGPSVYLMDGLNRYRLFFRNATQVEAGKEYMAEGVLAQKAIDAIGDPDNGKNGYPLESSCAAVIRKTWPGMAFDVTDGDANALCAKVKRYPARQVFLVMRLTEATAEAKKAPEQKEAPEIEVAADKQRAALIEGPATLPAPLWAPDAGTAKCKVIIDPDGKVSELASGSQLCEAVPWAQFHYKPAMKGGKPANVSTEIEIKFEARK